MLFHSYSQVTLIPFILPFFMLHATTAIERSRI